MPYGLKPDQQATKNGGALHRQVREAASRRTSYRCQPVPNGDTGGEFAAGVAVRLTRDRLNRGKNEPC